MKQFDELSPRQCLAMLGRNVVGRVGINTPMGPRVIPVNYTVHAHDIVFRTTPYSELGTYGRDVEVAFEVDEIDTVHHVGTSTVVRGRSALVEDVEELRDIEQTADPRPWPEGRRDVYLKVPITELSGRRIRLGSASASDRESPGSHREQHPQGVGRPVHPRARQQTAAAAT